MKVDLDKRSELERAIVGALVSSMNAHGPITRFNVSSAAKRVIGVLKQAAQEQAVTPEEDDLLFEAEVLLREFRYHITHPTALEQIQDVLGQLDKKRDEKRAIAEALAAERLLAVKLADYVGSWVAVSDHDVIAHAPTLEELGEDNLANAEGVFQVAPGPCFFGINDGIQLSDL